MFLLALWLWKSYRSHKAALDELLRLTEQLNERFLIAEVMDKPKRADAPVYFQILKMVCKSMQEQTGAVRRERTEYKEHIEQWVHKIKTPITAMKLLCENHPSDFTKEMLVELEKTNRFKTREHYCSL